MQSVTNEYKKGMKLPLRNRSYMMVTFGVINQEAQSHASIGAGNFLYYSCNKSVFEQKIDSPRYASLEQDYTTVDGSMYFPPRPTTGQAYIDTGLISNPLINDNGYDLTINLNVLATDLKGITIDFGETYPTDFDIVTSEGQVLEVRNNTLSKYATEEVLENTTFIRLIVYRMSIPYTRLRIYSILMGFGLVYHNKDIMDSQLESYISPISEDVSQMDFMVKLQNYNQYFNVDNPNSAINFLETGQQMTCHYGYYIPERDNIEWIKGGSFLCSEWESDDFTATIRGQDIFRSMDSEYYKGIYRPEGISLYDLAELVFADADITNYYIDPYLRHVSTRNPLPRVKHREALQIIANAGRCVLSQNRDGYPQITSSFLPLFYLSSNGEMEYSNIENIKHNEEKIEYASFAHEYTVATGVNEHLPHDFSEAERDKTGYVSLYQSNEECVFETNPIITIVQESECKYYGLRINFGYAIPAEFEIRTFRMGVPVTKKTVSEAYISKNCVVNCEFPIFDTMEIEFTKTAEPFNRITINHFSFGDITDFTMERHDMTTSPKSIKQELIKNVDVICYFYNKTNKEDTLISEDVEVVANETRLYFVGEPTYNFKALIDEGTAGAEVISSGAYYCEVKFKVSGSHKLEINGYRYNIATQNVSKSLNNRGKTITWENPLVGDLEIANNLAIWLGDYYEAGIEYEYNTRGNPEIDCNDIVYQESAYRPDLKVNIYRQTVKFNTSLSGKVSARRSIMTKPYG